MSKELLRYVMYGTPLLAVFVLFYVLNSYNPAQAGPQGILVVFICIYLIWLGIFFLLLDLGIKVLRKLQPEKRNYSNFDTKKAYYIASIVAFMPTLLLAVQSVGQLQLTDILLAIAFIALAVFYVVKRT